MNELTPITHHWKVQFSFPVMSRNPATPGAEYKDTAVVGVIAPTIESAITAVTLAYPRATITAASHQGKIQIEAR